MTIDTVIDLHGGRCCEPHKLAKQKLIGGPMKPRHRYLVRGTFAFPQDEDFPDYARVTEAAMYWVDASDLREHVGTQNYSNLLQLVSKCFEDAVLQLAPSPGAGPSTSSGVGSSRGKRALHVGVV